MIKIFSYITLSLLTCSLWALSPTEAYNKLRQGNERFSKGKALFLNQDIIRRQSTIESQNPFAVIVACADSRVSPEIFFDQGIGDLFVVRVAGNVVGPYEMESIEYAAKYLKASLIMVVGHENCGAVDAVLQGKTADIQYISQLIKPSTEKAKASQNKNLLETAIKYNAEAMSDFVKESVIISDLISKGQLDVKTGYYDFQTGLVKVLHKL